MAHAARLRALPQANRGARAAEKTTTSHDLPLTARAGDVILTLGLGVVAVWLWTAGGWAPGADTARWVFTGLSLGPAVFRGLASHFPSLRAMNVVASFWVLPSMVLGHTHFSPVVDSMNPRLFDAQLARMDEQLFGAVPSFYTDGVVAGATMDLLLLCYYSYFLWPFLLGIVLFLKKRVAFCELRLAMILFFVANFALYVAVPAVGPRFFLANGYEQPLQGLYVTPLLDGLMRVTSFNRDCFPSGHTGFTLVVLFYAFQYARRFFWVMLLPALGLITATVLGRFHYAIDLLCAVPVVLVVVSTAAMAARAEPQPVRRLVLMLRKTVQLGAQGR